MKKKLLAFTLLEILVVISIIGILIAAGATSYSTMGKISRDSRRKADLEQIRSALEMYRSNSTSSSYPSTTDTLSILWTVPPGIVKYLETAITDPKGYSYKYTQISGSDYTLSTYLEIPGTICNGSICGSGAQDCTYCVGPYGKK